jgi:hypothetical protein
VVVTATIPVAVTIAVALEAVVVACSVRGEDGTMGCGEAVGCLLELLSDGCCGQPSGASCSTC